PGSIWPGTQKMYGTKTGLFTYWSGKISALNLEDHLGLVISPQSPLSAGYITLRACRRSLPLRLTTVTTSGVVRFLIMSYPFNIPDRLVVHLSILTRPKLRAHGMLCRLSTPDPGLAG
ncbi:hypothetical protein AH97_24335, partial [Salmonella enterica subsp. enterica]|nr:hypothetical protein [Salmonella enterica subsp. enterica serovar Hartford]